MYNKAEKYKNDLINSYSWNTAIVFIQSYADEDYSKQTSKNTNKANAGVNSDKVCNIHNMAKAKI